MKTVIAGSRHFDDVARLERALAELPWEVTEVVSDRTEGPALMGEAWAYRRKVSVKWFEADPRKGLGAAAAAKAEMCEYAEGALVFHGGGDGKASREDRIVARMGALGKPVHVVRYNEVGEVRP